MGDDPRVRPVLSSPFQPESAQGSQRLLWPEGALQLAQSLQQQLMIGDRDWHALKAQRCRRASEQIAAALVQLLAADQPGERSSSPPREEAIALLEHAIGWLKAEVSDPGCPSHGR